MIRLAIILFFLYPVYSYSQTDISSRLLKRCEKTLRKEYDQKSFQYHMIDTTSDRKLYKLLSDNNDLGYIVFTQSKGRTEYFQYMVLYNEKLHVQKVKILQYNSSYGTAVASKRWLRQFEGNNGETLDYGSNINAISGATYSATSITNDVPLVTQWVQSKIGH
ncbi:MAG TPA: FMN-binding protein [Prolixibacteraceae bacterium]|nr:FMN-binding protein [Prolixibacteraceae bacterium]